MGRLSSAGWIDRRAVSPCWAGPALRRAEALLRRWDGPLFSVARTPGGAWMCWEGGRAFRLGVVAERFDQRWAFRVLCVACRFVRLGSQRPVMQ